MKKQKALIGLLLLSLCVIALFFLRTDRFRISGTAAVLSDAGEPLAKCRLTVEVWETGSCADSYRKDFAFSIDDHEIEIEPIRISVSEAEHVTLITQSYYDKDENAVSSCSLVYSADRSYAEPRWNALVYRFDAALQESTGTVPMAFNLEKTPIS